MEAIMTVTSPTTIVVSSTVPGDPPRHKTADLLSYPTLDEIQCNEGSETRLEFEWRLEGGDCDRTTTPVYVTSIEKRGDQSVIRGRTGRRGRIGLKVEIVYNDERPLRFCYTEMM